MLLLTSRPRRSKALGLPDDCEALTTLRRFRDEVMLKSHSGRRDVAKYYATAPAVVATIDRLPNAPAIYRSIYGEYLSPPWRPSMRDGSGRLMFHLPALVDEAERPVPPLIATPRPNDRRSKVRR